MADELSDDFVANALAKEARERNIQYSAMGLEAFVPKKPANHPKPNTRFLRNIIKETDTHNAALLAKEAEESKARLQEFSTKQRGGDIRRRQLGDIAAILSGSSAKRRKLNDEDHERKDRNKDDVSGRHSRHTEDSSLRRRDSYEAERDERKPSHSHRKDEESRKSRSHRDSRRNRDYEDFSEDYSRINEKRREDRDTGERSRAGRSYRHRSRSRSRDRRHRHRRRSYSHTPDDSGEEVAEKRRDRHKEYSTGAKRKERRRSRSPSITDSDQDRKRRHHSGKDNTQESLSAAKKDGVDQRYRNGHTKPPAEPESDSDPLDEIIGPRPQPKSQVVSRGRGKISAASGIDSRFSTDYDPTADVRLDFDEENDWEQALEALRDRQKWRQQGADRLRAAGFTEDEIKKWESGGEKKEEDVKWAKAGEGREWDRGKFMTDDGQVVTGAEWGRLK